MDINEIRSKIKVMYSEEEIQKRIEEVAKEIDRDYKGEEIVAISVLKGAIFFTTDLLKKIETPVVLDMMQVSSYRGSESTGNVIVKKNLDVDIKGKNVLIVEDIIDTGYTLKYLKEYLESLEPKTIKTVVLADKKERREVDFKVDYVCFEVENKFLVGYGFDYDEIARNIPFVGYLE